MKGWATCSSIRRSLMMFRTLSDRTTVEQRVLVSGAQLTNQPSRTFILVFSCSGVLLAYLHLSGCTSRQTTGSCLSYRQSALCQTHHGRRLVGDGNGSGSLPNRRMLASPAGTAGTRRQDRQDGQHGQHGAARPGDHARDSNQAYLRHRIRWACPGRYPCSRTCCSLERSNGIQGRSGKDIID